EAAAALYAEVVSQVIPVSSTRVAEMVKLLENTFRAVNIGLVNEIAQMCHTLDIDVWEVIEAAKTKPFGFMPFYPGPGLGGHCIPIDPYYLSWKARQSGFECRFIELAGHVNGAMAESDGLGRAPDCVVICADHSSFDWRALVDSGVPIVDTRNALRGYASSTIVRLSGRAAATAPAIA